MRIGLITGEYPPMQGGVGDFTRTLARTFAAVGQDVHVLTDAAGVGKGDVGVQVHPAITNWNRASLGDVRRWAEDQQLDVLNLQYQTAAYNMAGLIHALPRLAGDVPLVVTFHDLRVPYLFPKAGPLREWAVLRLARDADAAIVTNSEDEQQLRQAGGVTRLHRIPIGSNISSALAPGYDRMEWRDRIGVGPRDLLLGYFGFLNRSKGVETLLAALAQLRDAGRPARLLMIGGRTGASDPTNAAYAAEIEALVARLDLTDRVLWTGYIEAADVSGYLRACDVCVLPFEDGVSFRRGSFMAALAHGCPIVTTQPIYDTPELIDDENVRLVPPGDAGALAHTLASLGGQPAVRQRLGAGALRLYAHFTWERIADQTLALYSSLSGVFV